MIESPPLTIAISRSPFVCHSPSSSPPGQVVQAGGDRQVRLGPPRAWAAAAEAHHEVPEGQLGDGALDRERERAPLAAALGFVPRDDRLRHHPSTVLRGDAVVRDVEGRARDQVGGRRFSASANLSTVEYSEYFFKTKPKSVKLFLPISIYFPFMFNVLED